MRRNILCVLGVSVSCAPSSPVQTPAASLTGIESSGSQEEEDDDGGAGRRPGRNRTTGQDADATTDVSGTEGNGGGSGTATSEETTGTPPATAVTPTDNGMGVTFTGTMGHRLVIDARGGRILEYSLSGENALSVTGQFVQQGSTLWVAPQSSWTPTWPPPVAHDEAPYSYVIEGTDAVFTGTPALGVAITKRIGMTDGGIVSLQYSLIASAPVAWAPWEVSRMAPSLCFFGPGTETNTYVYNPSSTPLQPVQSDGIAWVTFAPGTTGFQELLTDSVGWAGCATGPSGLLLLKQFPNISANAFAPGNGDLKLWWDNGNFIELEPIGPYSQIQANQPVTYDVTWSLTRLGADVAVTSQSPSLAAVITSLLP